MPGRLRRTYAIQCLPNLPEWESPCPASLGTQPEDGTRRWIACHPSLSFLPGARGGSPGEAGLAARGSHRIPDCGKRSHAPTAVRRRADRCPSTFRGKARTQKQEVHEGPQVIHLQQNGVLVACLALSWPRCSPGCLNRILENQIMTRDGILAVPSDPMPTGVEHKSAP